MHRVTYCKEKITYCKNTTTLSPPCPPDQIATVARPSSPIPTNWALIQYIGTSIHRYIRTAPDWRSAEMSTAWPSDKLSSTSHRLVRSSSRSPFNLKPMASIKAAALDVCGHDDDDAHDAVEEEEEEGRDDAEGCMNI